MHTAGHPAAPPTDAAAGEAGSRSDEAYRALKTRLLLGEFPLNVRLGEERLAALLQVSRTPVREALKRLYSEGLLERHPDGGGYQPLVPDVTVMRHLYEVRAGLELQALQRPARLGTRHDPAILEPLRDQWRHLRAEQPLPDPSFVLLDESFHLQLAQSAGNQVLVDMLRQVNERIRVVRMLDFLSTERIEATIEEHIGLAELVLAGRHVEAEGAFSSHLAVSMGVVELRVQAALARMVSGGRR
jgi:DNA-binding GntR family transcriptional regulator